MTQPQQIEVGLTVNGVHRGGTVEPRRTLADFLRHDLALTGTHVGCEHGVCGACTVLLDGQPVRSCLVFAVSAIGHEVRTVEGLGQLDETGTRPRCRRCSVPSGTATPCSAVSAPRAS